jgi:methyl-accepting chemotaxis protein
LVAEISAASQEQASGIEQVNRAITQMDSGTQSNAAQVEELSSTSHSLSTQAQHLKELVAHFKLKESKPAARTVVLRPVLPKSDVVPPPVEIRAEIKPDAIPKNVRAMKQNVVAMPNVKSGDWTEF